jgi:hypothetical protein
MWLCDRHANRVTNAPLSLNTYVSVRQRNAFLLASSATAASYEAVLRLVYPQPVSHLPLVA